MGKFKFFEKLRMGRRAESSHPTTGACVGAMIPDGNRPSPVEPAGEPRTTWRAGQLCRKASLCVFVEKRGAA